MRGNPRRRRIRVRVFGLAESRRFSEMGVGNQKRFPVRPVDRFPRTKFELMPLPDDGNRIELAFKRNPQFAAIFLTLSP